MTRIEAAWSAGYHYGWHDHAEDKPYGASINPYTKADDDDDDVGARTKVIAVEIADTMAARVGEQVDHLDKGRSDFDRGQQHALLQVHRWLADMARRERNA